MDSKYTKRSSGELQHKFLLNLFGNMQRDEAYDKLSISFGSSTITKRTFLRWWKKFTDGIFEYSSSGSMFR